MADENMNRKARRASEALQRKKISRYSVRANGQHERAAQDGTLVFYDKILQHPVYGPIHIVVDETITEEIGLLSNALASLRRIPLVWDPPKALPQDDPYVQWYMARGVELDHAQHMAAMSWRREAEDVRNSSFILAIFSYVDFDGDAPEDPNWPTAEEMERHDLPPRPVRLTGFATERKLSFVKDLLASNTKFSIEIEGESVEFPGFSQQFMTVMEEVGEKIEKFQAEGVIQSEEPVDSKTGFPRVDADGPLHEDDDAEGIAEE